MALPLIKIPKHTLLFRVVSDPVSDFEGPIVNGERCVPPQYNVFFYFNPFIADVHTELDDIPDVIVYRTTREIKIASLISPSKYTRASRMNSKFLQNCSQTKKSCLVGKSYDPCFKESYLKKNPDVMGWVGIGRADSARVREELDGGKLADVSEYVQLVTDKRKNKGAPELALYPFTQRYETDIIAKKEEYNYEHVKTLKRNHTSLAKFMKKLKLNGFMYSI